MDFDQVKMYVEELEDIKKNIEKEVDKYFSKYGYSREQGDVMLLPGSILVVAPYLEGLHGIHENRFSQDIMFIPNPRKLRKKIHPQSAASDWSVFCYEWTGRNAAVAAGREEDENG